MLESLKGDRKSQYSIRINDRFRVCLIWSEGDAFQVEIVRGRRGITADTALRLSRYLGTSAEFWIHLQGDYELRVARQEKMTQIERDIQPRNAAA